MKKFTIIALCLAASYALQAQTPNQNQVETLDSVYITSKTPIAQRNSGKVVVTITSEQLERAQGQTVAQVLDQVSGIVINGSQSNAGQNLGYFVRGGRNRQVVVLIDGVQQSDPSQISNDYDLRLVSAAAVEKIEIIKGASSVLYGSGAATAVISITTKKEGSAPVAATITSSLGTNRATESERELINEVNNAVHIRGTLDKFFYSAQFSHRYVNGLSAIEAAEGAPLNEADVFNRFNTQANLGYKITDNVSLSRFFAVDNFNTGFDDFSFLDADNRAQSEQLRTGGQFSWKFNKGSVTINDSHTWIDREFASSFPSKTDAQTSSIDGFVTFQVLPELTVVGGVNATLSSFNSFTIPFGETDFNQDVNEETAQFDIIDPYVNATYISDFGLNINAGARLNNHSNYGNQLVYNVNPSYVFDLGANQLKVLGSYSTAYVTPSLFQLYDPQFGNEELEPEENTTIEGGLELVNGKSLRVSAVYFNRDEDNFVDFITVDPEQFIFQYQNIAESFNASGVEVELSKSLGRYFQFAANYTYTMADERFAIRIPEHKTNATLSYTPCDKTYVALRHQFVGDRDDVFFNPETFESETITLDSYSLFHLDARQRLTDNITIFASLFNILDEEYEELYRFQTLGRNGRLGFTLEF